LTFRDASGLRPGQFLVYHGVRAGEVEDVALDPGGRVKIDVRVFPEFRDRVYREAAFSIEKPGGILDISGERQITMIDRPGPKTPIERGAIISGQDSIFADLIDRTAAAARDAWEAARRAGEKMAEDFAQTPAGRDLSNAMKDFSEKTAGAASQAGASLDEIKRQAELYREQLLREGREAEAERFSRSFGEWYEQARSAVQPATPAPTPGGAR
jgi:ABC-type transporter Mla subunit MlaD